MCTVIIDKQLKYTGLQNVLVPSGGVFAEISAIKLAKNCFMSTWRHTLDKKEVSHEHDFTLDANVSD